MITMTILNSTEIEEGTYKAVVDNVEDEIARIFIEEDGKDVGCLHINENDIPLKTVSQDSIYEIHISSEEITGWKFLQEETHNRKERMRQKFDDLSSRYNSEE